MATWTKTPLNLHRSKIPIWLSFELNRKRIQMLENVQSGGKVGEMERTNNNNGNKINTNLPRVHFNCIARKKTKTGKNKTKMCNTMDWMRIKETAKCKVNTKMLNTDTIFAAWHRPCWRCIALVTPREIIISSACSEQMTGFCLHTRTLVGRLAQRDTECIGSESVLVDFSLARISIGSSCRRFTCSLETVRQASP